MMEPPPARRIAGTAYLTDKKTPSRFHRGLPPPVRQRHLNRLTQDPDPGVGHHNIQLPILALSEVDHAQPALLEGDVLVQEDRLAASAADLAHHGFTASVVQVRYQGRSIERKFHQLERAPDVDRSERAQSYGLRFDKTKNTGRGPPSDFGNGDCRGKRDASAGSATASHIQSRAIRRRGSAPEPPRGRYCRNWARLPSLPCESRQIAPWCRCL